MEEKQKFKSDPVMNTYTLSSKNKFAFVYYLKPNFSVEAKFLMYYIQFNLA